MLLSDEGRTWSKPQTLFDGPDDDRDPSIVQLPSGRLLCNFFSLKKKAGGAAGWDGLGTRLIESDDLGRTWSAPRTISADYYCSSPVRILPDGGLILGLYKETDGKSWGASVRSEDGGRTWGPVADIPNGGWKLDAETDIIPLKDGRLLAIEREPSTSLCSSVSIDGGRTWSVSKPLGFPGHCPYLLRLKDGAIVLAHRLPQTSLHYSFDDGKNWSENVPVDDFIGAYPSMVELKDGSVLIVYYEEGAGSNIRAQKFRLEPGGVEWLSFAVGPARREEPPPGRRPDPRREFRPGGQLSHEKNIWRIRGQKNDVTLDLESLRLTVKTPGAAWTSRAFVRGRSDIGRRGGQGNRTLPLVRRREKSAAPYRSGFQTGIEVSLAGFPAQVGSGRRPDRLLVALDGPNEDLVCRIVAEDGAFRVRELLWPASVEPGSFDSTVVPFMQGMLLPKAWPRVFLYESISYGRGLYMPWWGFQRGRRRRWSFWRRRPTPASASSTPPAARPAWMSAGSIRWAAGPIPARSACVSWTREITSNWPSGTAGS